MKKYVISILLVLAFVCNTGFVDTDTYQSYYQVNMAGTRTISYPAIIDYLDSLEITRQNWTNQPDVIGNSDFIEYLDNQCGCNLLGQLPFCTDYVIPSSIASYYNVEEVNQNVTGYGTVLLGSDGWYGTNNYYPRIGICRIEYTDPVYIVGGYFVSKSPYKIYYALVLWDNANSEFIVDNTNYLHCPMIVYDVNNASTMPNIQQDNALYYYQISQFWMNSNQTHSIIFTDLSIFGSFENSSDLGWANGYFNINDVENYVDMNTLKNEGIITVPTDESEEDDGYISYGSQYNYLGLQGYFEPESNSSLKNILSFQYNDYMRLHPNEYTLQLRYDLDVDLDPSADGFNNVSNLPLSFQLVRDIPLEQITGFNGQNDGSGYEDIIRFADLQAVNGTNDISNFSEYLEQFFILKTGVTSEYYQDSSVIYKTVGRFAKSAGMYPLKGLKIVCRAKMIYTYDGAETSSGYLIYNYNLLTGVNKTTGNSISYNSADQNGQGQYTGQIGGNGGSNTSTSYGGSGGNVTINGLGNQPVYQLSETQLQGIAEMLNTITGTLQDSQENNGFWSVMKGCFDYIPERIWNWIIITIGAVCAGAVARWYLTSKR